MRNIDLNRREFLRRASALSAMGAGAPLAINLGCIGSAAAQTASDYKAIVCVFLNGGNDSVNTVLATDTPSWTRYSALRKQTATTIGLMPPGTAKVPTAPGTNQKLGGVLPVVPTTAQGTRTFAIHPAMTHMKAMFDAKRAAIVANVGPLIVPTTKSQYYNDSVPLPPRLQSHNDQQSIWQSFAPEGSKFGWGGRMGDILAGLNGSRRILTCISTSQSTVFLAGNDMIPYQIGTDGAIRIGWDWMFGAPTATQVIEQVTTATRTHLLEQDTAAVFSRSINTERDLRAALPEKTAVGGTTAIQYAHPVTGVMLTNRLAEQLQLVARIIAAQATLGVKRQVFFVSIGGWDTHSTQNDNQANLLARVSHALNYFDQTLRTLPTVGDLSANVTTFTASDFGRTINSNGDGTDHGWGSHHFVVGGAVKGGDIYGNFPEIGISDKKIGYDNPNEVSRVLLPEISVDQYAATMARWFGLGDTDLLNVFPNLGNFDAAKRDLGFML